MKVLYARVSALDQSGITQTETKGFDKKLAKSEPIGQKISVIISLTDKLAVTNSIKFCCSPTERSFRLKKR